MNAQKVPQGVHSGLSLWWQRGWSVDECGGSVFMTWGPYALAWLTNLFEARLITLTSCLNCNCDHDEVIDLTEGSGKSCQGGHLECSKASGKRPRNDIFPERGFTNFVWFCYNLKDCGCCEKSTGVIIILEGALRVCIVLKLLWK